MSWTSYVMRCDLKGPPGPPLGPRPQIPTSDKGCLGRDSVGTVTHHPMHSVFTLPEQWALWACDLAKEQEFPPPSHQGQW